MLGLATALSQYPFDPQLPLQAEARSRSCGSIIALGLSLDDNRLIANIGMQVSACAIGQASAALLAQAAAGIPGDRISATAEALEHWLAGTGALPDWPGLEVLAQAREHPGRHGALLLPWTAACLALSSGGTGS